jgi:hypothetical protein
MPNGRSGGFVLERADLKQLVQAVSQDAVVGKIAIRFELQPASAAEIARCIDECSEDRVAVEEQDHAFYIVHIGKQPVGTWLSVTSESAIFAELRRHHTQWMSEHPGWDGWIAF